MHSQQTPPEPCWGPDHTAQHSVTTARSCFDSLIDPTAGPRDALVLLSRVTDPTDWTPALLECIEDLLNHYEARDHMAASATYNTLLEKAILTRNVALVRMCLQEHRWHRSMDSSAIFLLHGTGDACPEILPLMLADPRFGPSFLPCFVRTAVHEYTGKAAGLVAALLQTPQVDPWLVWQQALDAIAKDFVDVPKIWRLGQSDLLDPVWAWRRSCAAAAEPNASIPVPNGAPSSRVGVECVPCPKLLTDLPEDIQYKLHTLLDVASVGRIRTTGRALMSFPVTRFAVRRLHFACFRSATEAGYCFDSSRARSQLVAALQAQSQLSNATAAAELIGRILVESTRHLTDPDLSLDLITMLEQHSSHSSLVTVYLTWALHTLLTCSPLAAHSNPTTSVLLTRLLTHGSLPRTAWLFVVHAYATARSILSHATSALPTIDQDGYTSMPHLLLYLTRTRTLPENFQPTHPDLTFRAPAAFTFEAMPPSTNTLLVLALAVLSENPHTVATLLKDTPPDAMNVALKQLALTLAVAKCSPNFVGSLLSHIAPPAYVVRAALVGQVRKVTGPASTMGDAQDDGVSHRALLDILFARLQDPSEIRSLLAQIGNGPESRWAWARAMWWWLRLVHEKESEQLEAAGRWAESFLEEVDEDGEGDEREDEWIDELRQLWAEIKSRNKRSETKPAHVVVEKESHAEKAGECHVQ